MGLIDQDASAVTGYLHGSAVILVHGCPYDIHGFADVTPLIGYCC